MNDLKILYRGDIDEAPEGTNVVQLSERTWATGRSGTLKTIAPSDFATEFWQSNPVYQLIRALCISAEQEERHPLFCGYVEIKGVKRELRTLPPKADDGFHHCPNCDFTYTSDPCEKCGWGFFAREGDVMRAGGDYTLWIAPAPKEPEIVVEKLEGDYAVYSERNGWVIFGDGGAALAFDAIEKIPKEFGIYRVTRKGEQDGK